MSKKYIFLLSIIALLAVMAFMYQGWWQPRQVVAVKPINFLAQIKWEEVDKIIVSRGESPTILKKDGERWRVEATGEWFVNDLLMQTMEKAWQTAAQSDLLLASNQPEAKKDFQTDSGLAVELWQGDKSLGAWGLGLHNGLYTYISPVGAPETYEAKGNLRAAFDYEEWRDFSIWNEPANELTSLQFNNGQNFKLVKEKDGWVLASNRQVKLNQGKVDRLAVLMAELSASAISDEEQANTGLADSRFKITATGQDVNRQLIIGHERVVDKKPTGEFYVKTNLNNNVYLIRRDQRDIFALTVKDLQD